MEIVDQLKSEDQMDIMMMMMMMHQTDKTQAFSGAYNDITQFSLSDYAGASVCDSITAVPHCSDGFQPSSYSFPNFPSSSSSFNSTSPPLSTEKQATVLSRWESELSIGENGFFSLPDSAIPTSMATMREMIFRIAAMQPIHIDPEAVKPPKRRNVKISKDPQSVAARHRREKISERIRILQRLVPGGTKMDTASMLDEAIHYVKFLKGQVQSLERVAASRPTGMGYPIPVSNGGGYFPVARDCPLPPGI